MRKKKLLNRILASVLTTAMIAGAAPVTALAAEEPLFSDVEAVPENVDGETEERMEPRTDNSAGDQGGDIFSDENVSQDDSTDGEVSEEPGDSSGEETPGNGDSGDTKIDDEKTGNDETPSSDGTDDEMTPGDGTDGEVTPDDSTDREVTPDDSTEEKEPEDPADAENSDNENVAPDNNTDSQDTPETDISFTDDTVSDVTEKEQQTVSEEITEDTQQKNKVEELDSRFDSGTVNAGGETASTSEYEYQYSGTEATITRYTGSARSVSIPSSIGGYKVTALATAAFKDTGVESVTIPATVTKLQNYYYGGPFTGAESLRSVTFAPGTKKIPENICYMRDCENNISSVTIPDSVTEIEDYAFWSCKSLRGITLPPNLTDIGYGAFRDSGLGSISIPKTVRKIGSSAFGDCTSLSSVTMNYNDTIIESEKDGAYLYKCDIGPDAFDGDTNLRSVVLTENVETIGAAAFKNCSSLTSLVLPERVTAIGRNLIQGTGITSITVPKNVTTVYDCYRGGAFDGATLLKSVTFEEGIKTIPKYICYAREYSSYINSISIPDSVTEIGDFAFAGCKSLKGVSLSSNLTDIGYGAFRDTGLGSISIPKTVSNIQNYAFGGCTSLSSVTMNYNDTIIESEKDGAYLYKCNIGLGVFEGDTNLRSVALSENVEKIDCFAFKDCSSLTSLVLPERVTAIGRGMIQGTGITSITVPKNVTTVYDRYKGGAFDGATSLKSVTFEEGMKMIPEYICYAREYSSYINSVSIPDSVTEIGDFAFGNCTNLKELEFSDNVKMIDNSAYSGCTGLIMIKIGKKDRRDEQNVSELKVKQASDKSSELKLEWKLETGNYTTIKTNAFQGCTALKTVSLSSNVDVIENYAFNNCSSLKNVYLLGMEEEWDRISIADTGNAALINASRRFTMSYEDKETGYEIAYGKNTKEMLKNTEFVQVPETVKTVNFLPEETSRNYYVRIRKCTKYKNSGNTIYGNWSQIASVYMSGVTTAAEVQDTVKALIAAMEKYTKQLKMSSEAELENYKDTRTEAQLLRETDESTNNKMVTFVAGTNLSDQTINCIYEALARYIQSSTKFDLGKLEIKSKTSAQKYAKKIIDDVCKNIKDNTTSTKIATDVGTMELSLNGFSGGFSGSVFLINRKNARTPIAYVGSTPGNVSLVMTDYLQNLSDTVNDLLYQSCVSLFTEFANATSLTDYFSEQKASMIKDVEKDIRKAGYGNLYKFMAAMKQGYEAVEALDKCKDSKDMEAYLTNAKSYYEKIDKLDFSDSALSKVVLKDAAAELENRRKDLANLLYSYYTGKEPAKPSSWAGKIYNKIMGNCPINMIVYDVLGNEIGRVVNGRASYKPEAVFSVKGNTKTAYVEASVLGRIVFTGTGSGTMNYSIQEVKDDEVVNQINYYDVPLEEGLTYTQEFTGDSLETEGSHTGLVAENSDEIKESNTNNAETDPEYVTVSCMAEKGGTVTGDGTVIRGQRTSVEAKADEGYTFAGWYKDEELVSSNKTYYFAPSQDVALAAKFEKQIPVDEDYAAVAGDDSQSDMYVVKNENGTGDLNITGTEKNSQLTFVLKCYPTADGSATEKTIVLNDSGDGVYIYTNLNYTEYEKIELYDTSGKLLATLWKKELLQKNIGDFTVTLSGDKFRYTGKAICPTVSIADLDENLDYTVAYKNNTKIGKASVVITGMGDYKGAVTKNFTIYCDHKNTTVSKQAKAATCTKAGYTKETKCTICGQIITKSMEIKALGHKAEKDKAVAATALAAGKTEGSHCSVCGTVLKKQVTVQKLTPKIRLSVTKKTIKATTSFNLAISGMVNGDSVEAVTSSSKTIAKVTKTRTNNYKITGVKKGTARITVTLRSGKKAVCTVKVESRTLTVNKTKVTLAKGKSFTLRVKGSPAVSAAKKTLKFSSSNSKIATVTSTGKIVGKKAGTCKIYVKGNGITKTVVVTVKKR